MNKVTIVSIKYLEKDWQETKKCIEACGVPVVYVDRNPEGIGSLAEAINRGLKQAPESELIWFVTNVTFNKELFEHLLFQFEVSNYAAIHPCFDSDHKHLRQKKLDVSIAPTLTVPFIEFTAPMVRYQLFKMFPLDEQMPYAGHDIAWSYDVRQAGYELGVYHDHKLGHTYIRHSNQSNKFTKARHKLRKHAVDATVKRLIERYGPDYEEKLQYKYGV